MSRSYLTMGTLTRLELITLSLAFGLIVYGCYITVMQL